ncbi:MAG: N-acetylneuraminate lyase [Clostridia bacterium]|nr:N-acetylneuraminate lyase [Clostridia bacterium]
MFKGIFTALLTPFYKNNKINENALDSLIKYNLKMGVRGFYVCGSTGEALLLSTEERKEIMKTVKACAPDATLIAHVGSVNEAEAIELAQCAERLGYNAISSVAPYYYKFSFEEIKNYYYRVASSVELPMLVYHFPSFSGVNMGISEMAEFLENDKFMGIKFTSNDFFTLEQCKSRFPDKIVYNGYDEMFLAGLSMGADGGIGSTYNFLADKFVMMHRLFKENNILAAQKIQTKVNKIITILCKIGVMQAEKEVLNQLGINFGICRHPFGEPTEEQKRIIAEEIVPYVKPL